MNGAAGSPSSGSGLLDGAARPARDLTLPQLLAWRAAAAPEDTAMRQFSPAGVQEISWSDSLRQVRRLASALQRRGYGAGEVFTVVGPASAEMFWTAYAAWAFGAIVVGMWPGASAEAIAGLAADVNSRLIVCTDPELARALAQIMPGPDAAATVIDASGAAAAIPAPAGVVPLALLLDEGRAAESGATGPAQLGTPAVTPGTPAAMFRTSGSTGRPKSALHTHASLIAGTQSFLAGFPAGQADDHVPNFNLAAPAEPVVGTVNHLLTGLRMNFPAAGMSYDDLIREVSPVYMWTMPPTWAQRAAAVRAAGFHPQAGSGAADETGARDVLGAQSTRWALTGGTALSADVMELLQSIGLPLFKIYASAEMLITMSGPCEAGKTDGLGRPLPGIEAEVAESGELRVRTPGLFREYYADPEATAAARGDDGWYRTGDAAYVDDTGEFRFVGRMTDLAQLGDGTMLSPQLVESRLRDSPYIAEAVAVRSAGEDRQVLALLVADENALRAHCEGHGIDVTRGGNGLLGLDEVASLLDSAVAAANAKLPEASRIRRYACLRQALSAGRDELTATGKIRRAIVLDHYRDLISQLSASAGSGSLEAGRPVQ
jgi:long-chain acyl-CoA synthetase